jgi:tRNA dimethylallyltransferase
VVPPAPVPCLVGATGTGKTEAGIALARRLGAEVVCCDALTVYRGLDLLTAKPSPPADVPHHLLDVVDPSETYSAARFVEDADRAVASIRARGRMPLVVGGTALYLLAWTKGLGARVPRNAALRARLEAEADEAGTASLHARLAAADPVRAAEVHANDRRRLVRALEIVEATGGPASALRREWDAPDRVATAVVVLRRSRDDLARRIRARVEAMAAGGVVEEARRLAASGTALSPEAGQAIGLQDLLAHVEGRLSLADWVDRTERATRAFARRQETFFKRFAGATWLDLGADATAESVADAAWRALPASLRQRTSS